MIEPTRRRYMMMDTEGMVLHLRDNLRDRYKDCFCIVQELLQNADDAKASHVHFGMSKGLDVDCSLLNGPALFVVNDGPVSVSDLNAIFRVAAGNKRADEEKIGKFGLGMKSVFHVCDGFLLFGEGLDCHAEMPTLCTPWTEEYHESWWESWDSVSSDAAIKVKQLLSEVVCKWDRWFCVWIPMRNEEMLENLPPILKMMPHEGVYDELTGIDSGERASRMLPMLKNLQSITFKGFDGKERAYEIKSQGRLRPGETRLQGSVAAHGAGTTGYTYRGVALEYKGEQRFKELQGLSCWPESAHLDLSGVERVVDKTQPSAAVCILEEESSSPRLTVAPCVYLPLSDVRDNPKDYSVPIEGKKSITIYLHGSLFVDAGRQSFVIGKTTCHDPQSEKELSAEWNRRLWRTGILPLLVKQLFAVVSTMEDLGSSSVMARLQALKVVTEWVDDVCAEYGIARQLCEDGYKWSLIPSHSRVYAVEPPRSPVVRKVIAQSIGDDECVIDASSGRLMKSGILSFKLPKEVCETCLRTIAAMSDDESDNEILRQFALDCAARLDFATLGDDLRQARIWKVGLARRSYDEILALVEGFKAYTNATPGLKEKMLSAIDWTLESISERLAESLGFEVRRLDASFVVDVLHQKPKLKDVDSRKALLDVVKRADVTMGEKRRAIRYLLHGNKALFGNEETLYTIDSSLPSDFANQALSAISSALYESSYSIPSELLAVLSQSDREEYGFGCLTKDSIAVALADTKGISYVGFSDDSWKVLLRVSDRLFSDESVRRALRAIPLFPLEGGRRGCLSDSCYYERSVKIPDVFRSKVNILVAPPDNDLAERLERIVPTWKHADTFQFCQAESLAASDLSIVLRDTLLRTPSVAEKDREFLRSAEWVPTKNGEYLAPDRFFNVSGFIPPETSSFVALSVLEEDVRILLRRHELLTEDRRCVRLLIEELSQNAQYRLGALRLPTGVILSSSLLLDIFRNRSVLPVVSLLENLGYARQYCDDCIKSLIGPVDATLIPDIVSEVTDHILESRDSGRVGILWSVLCSYLDEAAESTSNAYDQVLANCRFLNENMYPRGANDLCTGGASVPSDVIINSNYRNAHAFFARLHDNRTYYRKDEESEFSSFEEYFRDWGHEFDARIGGFIVATSDIKKDIELVRRKYWTDSRNIGDNRNKVCAIYDTLIKGQDTFLHAKMGDVLIVRTISGSRLEVPMKDLDSVDDLFIAEGNPLVISPSPEIRKKTYNNLGNKLMVMRLRMIPRDKLESIHPRKLDELLKNTLSRIVEALCVGESYDVENFWGDLTSGSQLSIIVTRSVMLNHASYYLGMLGVGDEKLERYFSALKDLETFIEDARKTRDDSCQKYLADKDRRIRELGSLIEEDERVSGRILAALRREMRNRYEYDENSILYELFQNADDASEQQFALRQDEESASGRFDVRFDGKTLVVAHWGRVINSVAATSGTPSAYGEFKRDLENMLMLMQSGKKTASIAVTGKFGLGFKTVFFVCDQPIVFSGSLRFKIHGGFLPQALSDEENQIYADVVRAFANEMPSCKPTVYILPIVEEQRDKVAEAVASFANDSALVTSLAKRIRRVRVKLYDRLWDTTMNPEQGDISYSKDRFVISLYGANFFFGNKDDLPAPLSDTVATYWATVPTRLCLRLGFALNGDLDLTTGRAKINDSSDRNPKLVARWAEQLYDVLCQTHSKIAALDDGGYAFHASLWNLMTVKDDVRKWENPETNLMKTLLWDDQSGAYRRYIDRFSAVPSGLSDCYQTLCKFREIETVVGDRIAQAGVLGILKNSRLVPGRSVASDVIRAPAKGLSLDIKDVARYGFVDFLRELYEEHPVIDHLWSESDDGARLLNALKNVELTSEEKEVLDKFLFLSNGAETRPACELIIGEGAEELIYLFAPGDRQLSARYGEVGRGLFKLMRRGRVLSCEEKARLAAAAATDAQRIAVLRYVNETGDREFSDLIVKLRPSWLAEVPSMTFIRHLEKYERRALLSLLWLDEDPLLPEVPVVSESRVEIKELDLSEVARWWENNSSEYLSKYNDLIYDRKVPAIPDLTADVSSFDARSEWLELFVLSASCSLGFRECQHKGFVRMLKERKFWDVYVDKDSTPEQWLDTLEDFLQEEEFKSEYQCWMRIFFRIYQFATHLEDYVSYVQTFSDMTKISSLDEICRIRTNQRLSGSGIAIPGLVKAFNIRGRALFVRELVRRKALKNPAFYKFCFMRMNGGISESQSASLYNKAQFSMKGCDPTFGGAFDIAVTAFLKDVKNEGVVCVY